MQLSHLTRRALLAHGSAAGLLLALGLPAAAQDAAAQDAAAQDAAGGAREIVEMSLGDPDAPVTVVEYASLTCPHCATFHRDVLPRLREEYVDTGRVHYVMREVYFDRPGLWASMLARCAGADRYFGMLDLLYAQQADWSRSADPAAIVENLYGIGRQAGMTREGMDACFQDGDFARGLVAWYQENATRDGVESTPSFLIDGERTGNMPWPDFRSRLESALAS